MAPSLSPEEAVGLLGAARDALHRSLGIVDGGPAGPVPDSLRQAGASFVTLLVGERLGGCIGTLEPFRPLVDDVEANALAAAFDDPRLPALRRDDIPLLTVKVSIVGAMEPLAATDRAGLEAQLRPGVDGLVLEVEDRRATFLPSVWEQVPGPTQFVDHLLVKAGVGGSTWPGAARAWRYGTLELTSAPG